MPLEGTAKKKIWNRTEDHVKRETEIGPIQPQAKGILGVPGAGEGREGHRAFRESMTTPTP